MFHSIAKNFLKFSFGATISPLFTARFGTIRYNKYIAIASGIFFCICDPKDIFKAFFDGTNGNNGTGGNTSTPKNNSDYSWKQFMNQQRWNNGMTFYRNQNSNRQALRYF